MAWETKNIVTESLRDDKFYISDSEYYEFLRKHDLESDDGLDNIYYGGRRLDDLMQHAGEQIFNTKALYTIPSTTIPAGDICIKSCIRFLTEKIERLQATPRINREALEEYASALGIILFCIEAYRDIDEAMKYFSIAETYSDDGTISTMLGLFYGYGIGVTKDEYQARHYHTKALNYKNPTPDMYWNYGIYLYEGRGGAQNTSVGMTYIQKAADGGFDKAIEFLRNQNQSSSLCFITTAVCSKLGKADDCYELTTLRNFRDNWLKNQPDGDALIKQYYEIAPAIVEAINAHPNALEIYDLINTKYITKCVDMIEDQQYDDCKSLYIEMVNELSAIYGNTNIK